MKNNLNKYFLILFASIFFHNNIFANEFNFDVSEINIFDNGNLIKTNEGVVTTKENDIIIEAKQFQYNKISSVLIATNGNALLKKDNIKIKADRIIYDKRNYLINATGNVIINNLTQNIVIKTSKIVYNKISQKISSDTSTTINDSLGNIITSSDFMYTFNNNLVKLNSVKIISSDNDIMQLDKAYINLLSKKVVGKDVLIDFNKKGLTTENEPRLKGNAISIDQNVSTISKGIFTTCKRNNDCPPWEFLAKEIKHDKEKKTIYYKNAWLRIYNQPVVYFPKFFHPDPTVKRQSGFLMPAFKDSTSQGSSFQIPYFYVLSENKDFTITPRIYSNQKFLAQSEYRQVNKNSDYLIDSSLFFEKNSSTKNHLFLQSNKELNPSYFEEATINFNLERVSNDTYLKINKLESPIINDYNLLKSSVGLTAYKEDLSFTTNFEIYENLSKNKSDRYEYILPNYNLIKNFQSNEKLNGSFLLTSSGYIKNYNTNILDKVIINDLIFSSNSKFSSSGIKKGFNFLIKNTNTDSKNSLKYQENLNHKLYTTAEYNTSWPLIREFDGYQNIFKPIISLRYSPDNSKNMREENRRINTNNIFNLNRIASNDSVEGGSSITYGTEFIKSKKLGEEIINIKLANILKNKEDKNLPRNSSLGQKTSDIFGSINFSPNNIWSIGYEFAQDNDLSDTNFQIFKSEMSINNFVTTFEYLNENNTNLSNTYLANKTSYQFNSSSNIAFETRKNKKTKLTEFYNLLYQYRNDCLVAGIEYNKDYYSDRDLEPDESIFFKLTIIPFGQTSSPNLIK
mgnify:CR=1 FL=1|tara:strand:+ start:2241 stop:4628 length:2388 start_codon:yes stop_codon:yes gene_type:complete